MGLILIWIAFNANGDNYATSIMASIFTFARIAHTLCYIYEIMPLRTYCWFAALLCSLGQTVNILYGAFR